jgi:hypothetical protein
MPSRLVGVPEDPHTAIEQEADNRVSPGYPQIETIGTGAFRGFWPAPTTSNRSRPAGTREIPFRDILSDDFDGFFARHVLTMKMFTFPG